MMKEEKLNGRKVLVLGGTGAMGVYLVPMLASRGYKVTVVSLDEVKSDNPRITYIKGNAMDDAYLKELLKEKFDAIVDFLIYHPAEQFRKRHEILLSNTDHYIFLSSYRIYDGHETPITENSPRLLDASTDKKFLATEDWEYSLYKAREEDILQNSKYNNWSIVRPCITYSKHRFQLVTLEADLVVARAMKGLPVVIPEEALSVPATMNWAGNTARMFCGLILNPAAYRECFTLATSEHHTWGEIAEYYKEIIGLEYVTSSVDDYVNILGGSDGSRYQLVYDRLFPRIIDASKIMRVAGLKEADLMPLRRGLEKELSGLSKEEVAAIWPPNDVWKRMDECLKECGAK